MRFRKSGKALLSPYQNEMVLQPKLCSVSLIYSGLFS